jgi:hypothetical protein
VHCPAIRIGQGNLAATTLCKSFAVFLKPDAPLADCRDLLLQVVNRSGLLPTAVNSG